MPYVDNALPLGTYIAMNYQVRERMEELCRAWLKMLQDMQRVKVAHGDLDLTNVLVQEEASRLNLKLIDYDNMWIPALKDYPQTERGKEGFQHPILLAKNSRPYDITMDCFAALSIYLSIRALSFYPNLYKECKANDTYHLLFTKEDYLKEIAPKHSDYLMSSTSDMGSIAKLRNKNNPLLNPYLADLCYSLYYDRMPNYNVYDIPPYLGEYGMPEPPDQITRGTRATQVAPDRTTVPAEGYRRLLMQMQAVQRFLLSIQAYFYLHNHRGSGMLPFTSSLLSSSLSSSLRLLVLFTGIKALMFRHHHTTMNGFQC